MQRALLGVDGNAGFALLGADLMSGEAEFVNVPEDARNQSDRECWAATQAFRNLKARLGIEMTYALDKSHPRFC